MFPFFCFGQSLPVAGWRWGCGPCAGMVQAPGGNLVRGCPSGAANPRPGSRQRRKIALTTTPSLALPLAGGGNETGLMHVVLFMRAARLDGDFFDAGRVRWRHVVMAGVEHTNRRDQVIADQRAQCIEAIAGEGEHAVEADQRQQVRRRVAHP